jgi:DNA-binding NarL/FixJ family response regulator
VNSSRTVLVASGDRLLAGAAREYIERHGWTVVGTALDGLQALAAVARYSPSAVLVLGDLPRLGPSALARQIRRRSPEITVLVVGESRSGDARVLPPDVDGDQILWALAEPGPASSTRETEPPDGVALLRSLTARERLVLKLVAEGLPLRAIALRLEVTQNTIRTHMQNLYAKLGAHSRLDVVRFAALHGLVGDVDEQAP